MLPDWPWVQAFRSCIQDRGPELLRFEMELGAVDIAESVPELKEKPPGIQAPPTLEPEQARFRLFHCITTFLKTATRTQPLVIILDNLHWVDKPTLLLLDYLGHELDGSNLLVLGTYRDIDLSRQHPRVETLGELTRDQLFRRIVLGGLGREEVSRFIETVMGGEPAEAFVELAYSRSDENPPFVTELLRMLDQEGQLTVNGVADPQDWQSGFLMAFEKP